jgi:hypothetical protein
MVGALLVFAFCLVGVLIGGNKNKNVPLAAISAIIGSIALLIAFPEMLSFGGTMTDIALLVVGLIGIICILMAFASKKAPTGIMLLIGAIMVAWALFRWIPTGPAAFAFLGEHVTTAGKELWTGITGWWDRLTSSGPLSGDK